MIMRMMMKSNKEHDLNRKPVFVFLLLDCPHLTHSALITVSICVGRTLGISLRSFGKRLMPLGHMVRDSRSQFAPCQ